MRGARVKRVIIVSAVLVGVCAAYVLAHLALIEVGREVVVVYEPTPAGGVHKARLRIICGALGYGHCSWSDSGALTLTPIEKRVRESGSI